MARFFLDILVLKFLAALGLGCCTRAFLLQSGRAGLLCSCSALAYGGGFSCCGARALGVRASAVVAHGFSCPVAWRHGLNPCLLHWWVDSLPLSHQQSPDSSFCSQEKKPWLKGLRWPWEVRGSLLWALNLASPKLNPPPVLRQQHPWVQDLPNYVCELGGTNVTLLTPACVVLSRSVVSDSSWPHGL